MATNTYRYQPDYAVPPGLVLQERLEVQGISHAEFARRCGRSPKLISEIISGKAPLEPQTALQFEKVLGVDAGIWLGIEFNYKLFKARKAEVNAVAKKWAKDFPVEKLVKLGYLSRASSNTDAAPHLLGFFGVGSIDAWRARFSDGIYVGLEWKRWKPQDKAAFATWLRLGELKAADQECAKFDKVRFKRAISKIHNFAQEPSEDAFRKTQKLFNDAGVALTIVAPVPKVGMVGSARWLSARKAVVQLSTDCAFDEQRWFDFFLEMARMLYCRNKLVQAKKDVANDAEMAEKTRIWASNMLDSQNDWMRLVNSASLNYTNDKQPGGRRRAGESVRE